MRNFTTQQQSTHPQAPLERRPRPWPGVHMFGESENGASQIGVPLVPHTWVKERRRRGRRSGGVQQVEVGRMSGGDQHGLAAGSSQS